MAQARREQRRFAMLPHIGGKYDVARFLRTGSYQKYQYFAPPETEAMRAAREEVERERAMHEARGMKFSFNLPVHTTSGDIASGR